jgi:outer membrane protein assembly factor BamB
MSNDVDVKHPSSVLSLVVAGLCVAVLPANASVNVTQHHNHDSRDGLYIDSAFTPTNAASLARDTSFNGTITGSVYAQPLYIENGPGGRAMVIAVTESNNVYALDAATGNVIWQRNVGTPITSGLLCGNISPLGITGTPIVDLASRSLFLDAETTPSAGTFKHMIYSLSVDTGSINAGWPVDVNAAVSGFDSSVQSERAALGIVSNILYVPYGGRFGDCGSYHGRLVGVQMTNPANVMNWATISTRAGVWGPGGVASDGITPFVTTGNGSGTTWSGNEAVIRLQPGPVFSGSPTDYWAPTNWQALDSSDTDLGGSGPLIVDVPGATPSQLVVALGKDGNAYLLNRANLGGVSAPVASLHVSSSSIIQAAATYQTNQGTYVAFRASSSTLAAFRINPANPPTITTAWSVSQSGRGSPFVTSTDGANNMIVWVVGSEGDQRLHGYDGDTGSVVYGGGGSNELMTGTRKFNTGIVARGRIYIANDNKVYAFSVPVPALQLTLAVSRKTHGAAGAFDIPLPLSGSLGVECRTGGATGDYTQVFTFTNNVTSGNASVTSGIGSVSGMPTFSGNTMTVNLTGVANVQTLTVTLTGVTDEFSQVLPDTPASVNMLIGDTNGNGVVNATDVAQTKAQVGQPVTSSNFRTDVNASGIINATDVAIVKAHSGGSISARPTHGLEVVPR